MKRVPEGFCIDTTEVTRREYFAWMESQPSVAEQSEECVANADYAPTCLTTGAWGLDRNLENPISCVDWCDAAAYCQAHGKRMCGAMDGSAAAAEDYKDASKDEWFAACSSGGQQAYVYGDSYEEGRCHETLRDTWGSAPTTSYAGCTSDVSGYGAVFDLAGNVAEWENSCEGDSCRIRGGSFQHEGNGTRCDAGQTLLVPRSHTSDAIGFRCCAD